MAKRVVDIEALNSMVPELPKDFEEWCHSHLSKISIYYRRNGKTADCTCGKCGSSYTVIGQPSRGELAACPDCGHRGIYEWKKSLDRDMKNMAYTYFNE